MSTHPDFTWDLKWWYFRTMCFVLGKNLVPVAILIHDWFSSCTLQTKFGFEMRRGNTSFFSSIIVIRGNTCLSVEDNAMYSASAVLSAIFVCRELRQNMGQLAYMITIRFVTWRCLRYLHLLLATLSQSQRIRNIPNLSRYRDFRLYLLFWYETNIGRGA